MICMQNVFLLVFVCQCNLNKILMLCLYIQILFLVIKSYILKVIFVVVLPFFF